MKKLITCIALTCLASTASATSDSYKDDEQGHPIARGSIEANPAEKMTLF